MLTGRRLFKTDSDVATLRKIQNVDIQAPSSLVPDLPEHVERVVMRALSKDADQRFPDLAAMADALRMVMAPEAPDVVGQRFGAWLTELFADEIAEERDRLAANSALAVRLREQARSTPAPGRLEADWEGQTTSMKPADPRTSVPVPAAPRLWPVLLLLLMVLVGTVSLAVVGVAVVLGTQSDGAHEGAAIDVVVEPDARVYVDGVLRGTGATLVISRLEPGEHLLRLEADGHQPAEERLVLSEGQALRYERVLLPLPADVEPTVRPVVEEPPPELVRSGPSLVIRSTPPGASVLVDGVPVGVSPVTWKGRADQEVTVRFELDGHQPVEGRVTLGSTGAVPFERALQPAAAPASWRSCWWAGDGRTCTSTG
jgi:hypothetical protein